MQFQITRKFCIGLANKQTNAVKALARRMCGFRWDADEGAREAVNKRAARIVSAALAGKPPHADDVEVAAFIAADLRVVALALAPLEKRRHDVELQMKRLARSLPVAEWAAGVRGLGELGLAVIVAEAGDLANYPNHRHLWKRLGLAPQDGKAYSTWRMTGGFTADDWKAAGYSPKRRAEIHACVAEPLFRQQTMIAGPYRQVYDARRAKAEAEHPDWKKAHLHMDGLRVMTKALVSDLWSEWRRPNSGLNAIESVAAASQLQEAA